MINYKLTVNINNLCIYKFTIFRVVAGLARLDLSFDSLVYSDDGAGTGWETHEEEFLSINRLEISV